MPFLDLLIVVAVATSAVLGIIWAIASRPAVEQRGLRMLDGSRAELATGRLRGGAHGGATVGGGDGGGSGCGGDGGGGCG